MRALHLLLPALSGAVLIRVFLDNQCSWSIAGRNTVNASGSLNVFAGSCTSADMVFPLLADNGITFMQADVALDVCSPSQVQVAIFSSANRGSGTSRNDNVLTWNDPDSCALNRLYTATLAPGVCTPVTFVVPGNDARPYRGVVTEYWRLEGAPQCDPPPPANPQALTFRTLWTRDSGNPIPGGGLCAGYQSAFPGVDTGAAPFPLPTSDTPIPFVPTPAVPRSNFDYFTDLPLLSAPQPGFCNTNVSIFLNDAATVRPRPTQVSLSVFPTPGATTFTMEVYNNMLISTPAGTGFFEGCATARDGNGVPTSPHYMGTITFPLSDAVSALCTNGNMPVWTAASNTRLAAQGVDEFQLSGRLFNNRVFPTSRTPIAPAPNTPAGAAAAAAAAAASQATASQTTANTGLATGAAGVAVAAVGLLGMGLLLWRTQALAARVEELTRGKGPSVPEWGAAAKKEAFTLPAVGTPNPAAGQVTVVTAVS